MVGGLPFLLVYVKGGMGAGDIKLLAAVGAWLGPWPVLHVLIVSGLATGCYSAGIGVWKRFQHRGMQNWHIQHRPMAGSQSEAPEDRQPGSASDPGAEVCAAAHDLTSVLSRPDKRWNAVPFGVMVALGVVVTALWLG
ncbi:MAG TPA: A24 family peptidase, partial [Planctomycetaceae bacterium]